MVLCMENGTGRGLRGMRGTIYAGKDRLLGSRKALTKRTRRAGEGRGESSDTESSGRNEGEAKSRVPSETLHPPKRQWPGRPAIRSEDPCATPAIDPKPNPAFPLFRDLRSFKPNLAHSQIPHTIPTTNAQQFADSELRLVELNRSWFCVQCGSTSPRRKLTRALSSPHPLSLRSPRPLTPHRTPPSAASPINSRIRSTCL